MNHLSAILLLAILLTGGLLRLFRPRKKQSRAGNSSFDLDLENPLPAAKHYVYFPQIRQALSAADSQYLIETAPSPIARRALRERRAVARRFLKGLREDFLNLARLGRIIAALSPAVSREQETQRLLLMFKFQFLYALVWLRLSAGNLPLQQLEGLTGLVGRLAIRMEEAMAALNNLQADRLPGRLSA